MEIKFSGTCWKIMKKKNKVCIIGLGYVGLTLSLHLAKKGIKVYGYDSNTDIVNNL